MRFVSVILALLVAGFLVSASAQSKSTTKVCTLKVSGMTCAGCEAAVKIAAKRVDGVSAVAVSYDKAAADVTYGPSKTTPQAIAKVITEKTGFKAVPQVEAKTQPKT